jgi:hypothetical protein
MAWSFWTKLKDIGKKIWGGLKWGWERIKPITKPIGDAVAPVLGRVIGSKIPGAGAVAGGVWRGVSGKPVKKSILVICLVKARRLKQQLKGDDGWVKCKL